MRKNFQQSDWPIEFSPQKYVERRIVGMRSTFRGSKFFDLALRSCDNLARNFSYD